MRGHRLPLRRGPNREGRGPVGRDRRLFLSSRASLSVRCPVTGQARVPRDAPSDAGGDGPQSPFGERSRPGIRTGIVLMAVATAPARVRVDGAPSRTPDVAPQPRPALASGRRGPRRPLQRTAALCGALVLCSLLMVVAASAYLTQGQVRLTRMQQQLTSELGRYRDLESRVAHLADPSNVVSQAQSHGLTAPSRVTDLPQVNLAQVPPTASTVPATPAPATPAPATPAAGPTSVPP